MQSHYLTPLFSPKSIAMYGASDRKNSVGEVVFKNLISAGFKGKIYPINLKHDKVQGKKAYKSIDAINKPVELAVVATPAKTIPAIVQACGEHGVKICTYIKRDKKTTDPETGESKFEIVSMPRTVSVFHISQTDKREGVQNAAI